MELGNIALEKKVNDYVPKLSTEEMIDVQDVVDAVALTVDVIIQTCGSHAGKETLVDTIM